LLFEVAVLDRPVESSLGSGFTCREAEQFDH